MRTVFLLALPSAALLAACDLPRAVSAPAAAPAAEPDRFHARTFSWDSLPSTAGTAPLSKPGALAARGTRFESREALREALEAVGRDLVKPGATDTLWKPLDHSCPEFDLALWNRFGEVRLRDSLVLDEALLRARCAPIGEDRATLGKSAAYASGETQHRVYPYKMFGRVWSDRDLIVMRSSGAETQFKKEREYFGMWGWWDTDATRIGVRVYLLDCAGSPAGVCYFGGEKSNWARNAASTGQTDFADWNETRVQTMNLPAGLKRLNLKVSAAAIAMHSADHAGIRFRASSSSGLSPSTTLYAMPALEYVTW